jgi:putative transposase
MDAIVTEHAAYWRLGNTPFEREARYRLESAQLLAPAQAQALLSAADRGWPVGPDEFIGTLAGATARPLRPRARGRPRRPSG